MENNLISGFKPVLEILEQNPQRVDQIFIRLDLPKHRLDVLAQKCRESGARFSLISEIRMQKMAEGAARQGVVARLHDVDFLDWPEFAAQALHAPLPLIVALDEVQDPGNVGVLARTLYALGGAGLLVTRHNSALLGVGAAKSSAGALARLPLCRVTNLGRAVLAATAEGWHTYAASCSETSQDLLTTDLQLPALLVLGNEERGIRAGVAAKCAGQLQIPFLRDFDSLNVAQAGAIFIYSFLRALKG